MDRLHPAPTQLRTARLLLRAPRLDDATWIAREIADPAVQRWLTNPPHPYRVADAEAWLTAQMKMSEAHVIEAGAPIGVITHRGGPTGEIGYWLARHAWGHGYMTEAAAAVINLHFEHNSAPVPSGYILGNEASRNVLTKLGFLNTTIVQRRSAFHAKAVRTQKMVLTQDAWAARAATH